MELSTWNDDMGRWELLKEFPRRTVEGTASFLWWTWKSTRDINIVEYCIESVNEAKAMYAANPSKSIRVMWRGDVIWQNGKWHIDTSRYDFYPDPY